MTRILLASFLAITTIGCIVGAYRSPKGMTCAYAALGGYIAAMACALTALLAYGVAGMVS